MQADAPRLMRHEVKRLLADELDGYLSAAAHGRTPVIHLPGVDPFDALEFGQAVARAYDQLPKGAAQAQWRDGLCDVFTLPSQPPEALDQLYLAVAYMESPELLVRMADVLVRRHDLAGRARSQDCLRAFDAALSAAADTPTNPSALESVRRLVSAQHFPSALVFDVFDLLAQDPDVAWWKTYGELRDPMNEAYQTRIKFRKEHELARRLRVSARRLCALPLKLVYAGMLDLGWLDADGSGNSLEDYFRRSLLEDEGAPLSWDGNTLTQWRDGRPAATLRKGEISPRTPKFMVGFPEGVA